MASTLTKQPFHLPKINTNATIVNLSNSKNQSQQQQQNFYALKEKIPIVRHIIRDADLAGGDEENNGYRDNYAFDLNTNQQPQLNPLELDKIIKLFVDPHSVSPNIF